MAPRLPKDVQIHLNKARESALLAVDVYNKPATSFRSGGYVVLMCIAWTSLFHAIFLRRGLKPFYRKKGTRFFERVDGDRKAWELAECSRVYHFGSNTACSKNLEFFIGLRNKIEHRSYPALDVSIFGECQALLFNFEDLLVAEFGPKFALNESLSFALQFSQLRHAGQNLASRSLHKPLARDLQDYLDRFRSSLTQEIAESLEFSYKCFLVPKVANHRSSSDLAVEFVRFDPKDQSQMDSYNRLITLVKPVPRPVANLGCLKASDVARAVEERLNIRFTASFHHARAARYYAIRPDRGSAEPDRTNPNFCVYDIAHRDYVYTTEWIDFLCSELIKPGQMDAILGRTEVPAIP